MRREKRPRPALAQAPRRQMQLVLVFLVCEQARRRKPQDLVDLPRVFQRVDILELALHNVGARSDNALDRLSRGLDPDHLEKAVYTRPLKAFLETHIEQGRVLEHEGLTIGAVTGIAAPSRFKVHLHGSADHSGATPMALRHDGLCAAALVISKLEALASHAAEPPVVGTVGICDVTPDVMNVIPGEVTLGIDIRSISADAKKQVADALKAYIEDVCRARGIPYTLELVSDETPAVMHPAMVRLVQKAAEKNGYPALAMPSGAGHDSMHWASYCPTGMIFIPCKNGISHNPAEYASPEDIFAGAKVFSEVIRTLSQKDFQLV